MYLFFLIANFIKGFPKFILQPVYYYFCFSIIIHLYQCILPLWSSLFKSKWYTEYFSFQYFYMFFLQNLELFISLSLFWLFHLCCWHSRLFFQLFPSCCWLFPLGSWVIAFLQLSVAFILVEVTNEILLLKTESPYYVVLVILECNTYYWLTLNSQIST